MKNVSTGQLKNFYYPYTAFILHTALISLKQMFSTLATQKYVWQPKFFSHLLSTYLLNLLWKQQSGECWSLVLSLTKACIKDALKICQEIETCKKKVLTNAHTNTQTYTKFTIENFLFCNCNTATLIQILHVIFSTHYLQTFLCLGGKTLLQQHSTLRK